MDAEGKVEGDLAAQTHSTLDNIESILAKVGADLGDVVKIVVYLTSLDDYASFSAVRAERFGDAAADERRGPGRRASCSAPKSRSRRSPSCLSR